MTHDPSPDPASFIPPSPARRRTGTGRRGRLLILVAVLAGLATIGAGIALAFQRDEGPAPLAERVDPQLPDLVIPPFSEFTGARDRNGTERIRFGVIIGNVGDGEFRVRAERTAIFTDDWVVDQQVIEAGGGFTTQATDATLVFGGDGHGHWHVKQVENHRLETLDGEVVGEVVKQGYCFFDTDPLDPALPGAPEKQVWNARGCGGVAQNAVTMGLSVGWGDLYAWHLFDQQIVVTDVPDGTYVLRATADPFGWFEEIDETNNDYWEEFELTRDEYGIPDVRVTRRATDG
jgi:hypothetical protein